MSSYVVRSINWTHRAAGVNYSRRTLVPQFWLRSTAVIFDLRAIIILLLVHRKFCLVRKIARLSRKIEWSSRWATSWRTRHQGCGVQSEISYRCHRESDTGGASRTQYIRSARIPANKLRKMVPNEYHVEELPRKYAKKVRLEMYSRREEKHWTGFVCPFIAVGNSSELALWHPSNWHFWFHSLWHSVSVITSDSFITDPGQTISRGLFVQAWRFRLKHIVQFVS